jgi:hypothetical protein
MAKRPTEKIPEATTEALAKNAEQRRRSRKGAPRL